MEVTTTSCRAALTTVLAEISVVLDCDAGSNLRRIVEAAIKLSSEATIDLVACGHFGVDVIVR